MIIMFFNAGHGATVLPSWMAEWRVQSLRTRCSPKEVPPSGRSLGLRVVLSHMVAEAVLVSSGMTLLIHWVLDELNPYLSQMYHDA